MTDLEREESAAERRKRRQGLTILTPNQMLSRLPIREHNYQQETILKNLKMKLGKYDILCTDKKNSQNNSIKVSLTLSKKGNNLYEH